MNTPRPAQRDAFTCDLSVDEFLLISDAGWEPVALVSGDCTFNPGRQASSRTRNKELNWISDAQASGQTRALERMRTQAAQAGGEGVVGVRLEAIEIDAGESAMATLQHYTAVGTAVRRHGKRPSPKTEPFTSHLSGQDTWALLTAGVTPVGLVFGFSVYHSSTTYRGLREVSEMTEITDAVYSARERAMSHMQAQAARLKATGVVGVTIDMRFAHARTLIFTALGTAITKPNNAGSPAPIRTAVDLADPATATPLPDHP